MNRQKGFSHPLAIVLILVVVAVVVLTGWRVFSGGGSPKQTTQDPTSSGLNLTEQKPRLKNLGLGAIAPYSEQTGMSGDVPITLQALRDYDEHGLKGFYVFGEALGKGDKRKNPTFEFASLQANTPVISSIDGVVVQVNRQADTNDYEVFLQPTEGSVWTVGYDHLIDVTVLKGQTIKVGDKLGTPAVQGNGLARFEIQVNYDKNGKTTHYCPSVLLDDASKATLLEQITGLQTTWETVSGKDLYNQAAQKIPGCVTQTMTPEQAEGKQ